MTIARPDERRVLLPLVLLLVFNHESVAHHNKVSVLVGMLQSYSQDIAEGIQAGPTVAFVVGNFQGCLAIEKLEEVEGFHDASDGFLLKNLIASVVSVVSATEHSFD